MYRVMLLLLAMLAGCSQTGKAEIDNRAELGKALFFDTRLSDPAGMSCASCHSPQHGFADPRQGQAVSEGIHKGRFTARNAPSIAYMTLGPDFHFDPEEGIYVGGFFHDGRAKTLAEQATGPLLSAVEMANSDRAHLAGKVRELYSADLIRIFGDKAVSNDDATLTAMAEALVAYQKSPEVNRFSSKYDYYLAGKAELSAQELRGLKIFEDENKGNCAACHPSALGDKGESPLFTDFTFDNLGVPRNNSNPFLSLDKQFNPEQLNYIDRGLGAITGHSSEDGLFKVPTLRNIAVTAPYMHNGIFTSLEEVVKFYNTRDTDKKWGPPEVSANVNDEELGDLKLSDEEVQDLVAFLKTLTDGYQP